MYGVEKSRMVERNWLALSLFLSPPTVLEFDSRAAEEYGNIRAALEEVYGVDYTTVSAGRK